MEMALKPLDEQVMVVTGASSGIGLATAKLAASRGACVVLVARDEAGLRMAVDEIVAAGGRASFVVADVAEPGALAAAAERAASEFDGIDTWVNNAGTSIYGRLEDVPVEDARRLFDVNYWGIVHGALAALPYLRPHGGALINVGSILSDIAEPLQGHYTASKHAVRGFTDVLRMELEEEGAPISVTLVKPAAIDTPFPEHARNYMPVEPTLPPPVYAPEAVAETILACAVEPVREITVGGAGRVQIALGTLAPRLAEKFTERTQFDAQMTDVPASADRPDALYAPMGGGRVRGNARGHVMQSSAYTRAALHPKTTLALLGAGAGLALMWRRARQG